jgi:hypothetical protein
MKIKEPSVMDKRQLIKSVLIAVVIGGLVLITAILPAEYNIDLLGTGKLFGFSKLYTETPSDKVMVKIGAATIKKLHIENIGADADVLKPNAVDAPAPKEQYEFRVDSGIKVIVKAGKGIEYKFKMLKYGKTKYEWSTGGMILYSDMHGEVLLENPPKEEWFESYTEVYSNNVVGTLTAPFEGIHGWYFRNKNEEDIVVTIKLKGQYQLFDIYNR